MTSHPSIHQALVYAKRPLYCNSGNEYILKQSQSRHPNVNITSNISKEPLLAVQSSRYVYKCMTIIHANALWRRGETTRNR